MHNRREHVQQANACLFVWFETKKEKTDGKHGKVINVSSDTSVQVQKKKTSFFYFKSKPLFIISSRNCIYAFGVESVRLEWHRMKGLRKYNTTLSASSFAQL